ncbi:MAG: hypothetical protein VKL59_11530 [Nostocaceae cyanobacterium]|nr:hypothetical protein [Nostocaceae cyanobacterium]
MKSQKISPISAFPSSQPSPPLFTGIWLRWDHLTQSEKVVCACIILIPLWWLWGWSYLTIVLAISIFVYHYLRHGSLYLRPSLFVIAGFVVGLHELISISLWAVYNGYAVNTRGITSSIMVWIAPVAVLWYIQTYKIRARLQVVAWAFSVVVLMMLIFWAVIFFVWKQGVFLPPRSLFGLLTGKGEIFVPGMGNSNFLMPYFYTHRSIGGMARYVFFFHGPESFALVAGFLCLLALDIPHKVWSLSLFSSSFFLLLLSGTRAAWLVIPLVISLRWLLTTGKHGRIWLVFALLACLSFTTLSVPQVNDLLTQSASNTASATSDFRADSTEVRGEIYRQTWKGFINGSDTQLIFGHVVPGETVLPGYAPAMVGTHSFILSTLLYRKGLLGTAIFLTYWLSQIAWLYQTRATRPISCLLVYLLFSLTFSSMEFESMLMPLILITAVTHKSLSPIAHQQKFAKVFIY